MSQSIINNDEPDQIPIIIAYRWNANSAVGIYIYIYKSRKGILPPTSYHGDFILISRTSLYVFYILYVLYVYV